MTKKTALFIFCTILFANGLKSQVEKQKVKVTASDSTVFKLEFVEYEGDDMYKNFIYAGFGVTDLGSILQLGYTRYNPEKFIATAELDAFPPTVEFNVSGIYFLLHAKNECKLKYNFMSSTSGNDDWEGNGKKYILKTNGIRNMHIGIHASTGYRNLHLYRNEIRSITADTVFMMQSYSSGRIAAGIGMVATRNGLLYVGNYKTYTGVGSMFMVFIDGIYYPAQRISYSTRVGNQVTPPDQASGLDVKDVTNGELGLEIRIMGQHQFHFQKSKIPGANFGFRWQTGLMTRNFTGPSTVSTFGKYIGSLTVSVYTAFGQ